MDKIKLLYARNLITRRAAVVRQKLSFVALVNNVAFEKRVDILWAGEDGLWHTLPASYHSSVSHEKEYWVAETEFPLTPNDSLPGNVQFALRYQVAGVDYWGKDRGKNYSIQADSGILAGRNSPILNTELERRLPDDERFFPVSVVVDKDLEAESVTIHWTSNNWKTTEQSPCRFRRNYWDEEQCSNARNPNHYGAQVWNGLLKVDEAFRIQYRFSCEAGKQILWDDNFGHDYVVKRRPLKVLILNLHCNQEDDQDFKLSQIAKAIDEQEIDIVCFQEVAELWNSGKGDWETNMARIINERLASPYHLVTDWSHLGFERFREGVAILSRLPIEKHEARYVSAGSDPYSIHSRKVIMAQIRVPHMGMINVFSAHLSWWDDGFPGQFDRLREWAKGVHSSAVTATLLCGDFNVKAGSSGYQHVVNSHDYEDQFLAANSPQLFKTIFNSKTSAWHHALKKDHRIDYVFLRKESGLGVTSAQELFTDQDYGRVSDHVGYLMTFEPKS